MGRDYVIITDSSNDLPVGYAEEQGVVIIPISFEIGDEVFDGREKTLTKKEFYDRMRAGQGTKTAAPNINDIEEEFEKALSAGKDVLFTCLSSGISSTINNAFVCKEEMQEKYQDAEICVFDSICASGGHGLLIYHAIENKKKGMSVTENMQALEELKHRIVHKFTVDDLTYLQRGGRISKTAAVIGGMIQLKPVLHVDTEGRLAAESKVRGRKKALNQLLAEMDGFDSSKGIFILAATNRPEVLDKALLRPGRLDRRITVDRPDKKGRIETLKVHSKDVLMDDTVDFDEIAMATSGLVGSDLANIINEAAIAAVKNGRNVVTQKDLLGAFDTVVAGKEKKERVLSKKEKQVVAYHEIGHALIRAIKNNSDPVQKITIIPHTNGSLGYVLNFPEEEKHLETKDELMTDLISLVGGRAAEEVVFGSVTNGAYDDIKKATNLAKTMITRYGMSDRFGLVALSTVEDEYLSGRASMNCAQATEAEVDDEVKKLIASCYEEAKQIIRDNREVMDQLARYLYDHETITGKEFMKIFREAKGIPEPVDTSLFSTSEKVAESVTFNEDGSYSSTVSGEPESDIWKNITNHSDDNNNEHHDNSDDKNDGTQE